MLIYICDDSKSDCLRLMHHLSAYENEIGADFSTVAFSSGDEMFSYLKKHREIPDLFFLDIYMEGKDGMEVARELRRQQVTSGIIFTTSSTEHAMDSYEVHALYYLQKPFTHEHFLMAMQRCEALIQTAQKKLSVSVKGKELSIAFSDILYLETGRHTVIFHTRRTRKLKSFCRRFRRYEKLSFLRSQLFSQSGFRGRILKSGFNYVGQFPDPCSDP